MGSAFRAKKSMGNGHCFGGKQDNSRACEEVRKRQLREYQFQLMVEGKLNSWETYYWGTFGKERGRAAKKASRSGEQFRTEARAVLPDCRRQNWYKHTGDQNITTFLEVDRCDGRELYLSRYLTMSRGGEASKKKKKSSRFSSSGPGKLGKPSPKWYKEERRNEAARLKKKDAANNTKTQSP